MPNAVALIWRFSDLTNREALAAENRRRGSCTDLLICGGHRGGGLSKAGISRRGKQSAGYCAGADKLGNSAGNGFRLLQ
jgi:hypothetical protein